MDDNKGFEGRGTPGQFGSDSFANTPAATGRSPDYDDDRLGDDKLLDGRHATDLNPDGTRPDLPRPETASDGATRAESFGDNRDGLGRDRSDRVAADETGRWLDEHEAVYALAVSDPRTPAR